MKCNTTHICWMPTLELQFLFLPPPEVELHDGPPTCIRYSREPLAALEKFERATSVPPCTRKLAYPGGSTVAAEIEYVPPSRSRIAPPRSIRP